MEPFVFNTDITAEWAKDDLEWSGAVMCHVYYGRGYAPSADSEVSNVLAAYRFAASMTGAAKIMFVTDGEDVGFAPVDDARTWGDDEGRLIDDPANIMGEPIKNEDQALVVYWENYGFAGGESEREYRVRDLIAEYTNTDPASMTEPQ